MVSAMSTKFPGSGSVGRVIDGKFRLVHWLGGTEHSSVYLTLIAGDPPRSAAIKLLPADDVRSAQWAAARALSHPHLMHLFQFGRCEIDGNELLYAVMEYAEEILSDVVAERPLTAAETGEMLPSIMEALCYLHSRGLVHGALAPSNIMAVGDRLKLPVDGLQTAGEPWRRNRLTVDYDAPEIATETMSPAMDVWSLGVVLVKVLTQETPARNWEGGGEPVVPTSVPEPFYGIARECLRVDPSRRITLANIKARMTPGARRAPAAHLAPAPAIVPANKGTEKTRSRATLTIAVVAVLVVGVVIAAVESSPRHRAQPSPAATTESSVAAGNSSVPPQATPDVRPPVAEPQGVAGAAVKGAVIHQVMPEAPQAAMKTIHGHFTVRIRVEVDPEGNVSNATSDSQGPSHYFAEFALKAAREWKFKPAVKDGRAVASRWVLQFQFSQSGIGATSVETAP
jgi:TonB family protein